MIDNEGGSNFVDVVNNLVHPGLQELVEQQSRDGDREACSRCHKGFINSGGKVCGFCRSAALRSPLKGVDHPVDSAKKAEERRNSGND